MQKIVLPAAKKALDSVRKDYQAAEEDSLELLDPQRTHLMTKREHLELFDELQTLIIEIESFSVQGIQTASSIGNKTAKQSSVLIH